MPRYVFPDDVLDVLITYLKYLGQIQVPGITDTSLTLETLLPLIGEIAEIGK